MSTCNRSFIFSAGRVGTATGDIDVNNDMFILRRLGPNIKVCSNAVCTFSCSVPETDILLPIVQFANMAVREYNWASWPELVEFIVQQLLPFTLQLRPIAAHIRTYAVVFLWC